MDNKKYFLLIILIFLNPIIIWIFFTVTDINLNPPPNCDIEVEFSNLPSSVVFNGEKYISFPINIKIKNIGDDCTLEWMRSNFFEFGFSEKEYDDFISHRKNFYNSISEKELNISISEGKTKIIPVKLYLTKLVVDRISSKKKGQFEKIFCIEFQATTNRDVSKYYSPIWCREKECKKITIIYE
ncbi:MAG: hypothetical protein J7J93_01280 [Candidatus Aenigmarchaeota archaeon]|nr:hypothetical protein [Candidatus Aenigmarchaeota archaeon]